MEEGNKQEVSIERTDRTVFASLGYSNAEEMSRKSELVSAISDSIEARGLSQVEAAKVVGLDQPTLSKLLRGRTRSVSMDKLTSMLNALGRDVTIVVGEVSKGDVRGHTLVEVLYPNDLTGFKRTSDHDACVPFRPENRLAKPTF